MRFIVGLAVVFGMLAAASLAGAAQLNSGDGLAVSLSDATGTVTGAGVDGRTLTPAAGVSGGLSFQEFARNPADPGRVVLSIDAEGEQTSWTGASFADWDVSGGYVARRTGDAHQGAAYLHIGDGKSPGVGMAAATRTELTPAGACTVSWWGRTTKTDLTYILCMRLFDKAGTDVSATVTAPPGWAYSPYSRAHYRSDPAHRKPATWEQLSYPYIVPEGVTSARVSLRVYRGGDLQADIDDLQVTLAPGGWSAETPVRGPVAVTPQGLVQTAEAREAGLAFVTRYEQASTHLRATVEVKELAPAPRGRCLRLLYRLPLDLTGWTWSGDPRRDETIARPRRYQEAVSWAGHPLSRYPLASVSDTQVGLAMAVPLDRPAAQTFVATADGLTTAVELGLSGQAPRAGGGFTFVLYRHAPAWTFRAALERYYALFPHLFEERSPRGGAWTLRLPKADVPAPEDFGLAFYECGPLAPATREYCRAHGIATFVYSEPWGRRQVFPQAKQKSDLPPYEARLAQVREWAGDTTGAAKWSGAPRAEVAQAVLNSLLIGPDGVGAYSVDLYGSWAQWWQLSTDPGLPEPNIASVCRKYEIDPVLEWADGIYLDSVSMGHVEYEDYNPAHLAAADLPLSFSLATGQPVVLGGMGDGKFMQALRDDLWARKKLLMLNLFAPATRLFGHLGDVVGCELGGLQSDDDALQQRVYAYRRPVSNLLQWKWAVLDRVPAMTPDEMHEYVENQLAYGFWPGISTIGGGTAPGYAAMHRFFEDPALFERDRALLRQATGLCDRLARAGWEPVTHVRSDVPAVRVERFGSGKGVLLTVHNTSDKPQPVQLALDRAWWEAALGRAGAITLKSELTAETYQATAQGEILAVGLAVKPRQVLVLVVG